MDGGPHLMHYSGGWFRGIHMMHNDARPSSTIRHLDRSQTINSGAWSLIDSRKFSQIMAVKLTRGLMTKNDLNFNILCIMIASSMPFLVSFLLYPGAVMIAAAIQVSHATFNGFATSCQMHGILKLFQKYSCESRPN